LTAKEVHKGLENESWTSMGSDVTIWTYSIGDYRIQSLTVQRW